MNEYMLGNIFGFSQTIIGYPFDTLKTNLQNSKSIKPFLKAPGLLYQGVTFPLLTTMIGTTFMFGNYTSMLEYTGNKFIAASITGIIGAFLITPFDYYKIQRQTLEYKTHNNIPLQSFTYSNNPFRGLTLTILRESISIPIYFITFDTLYYQYQWHSFLAGGVAGLNSWFFTYPLDTLKSRRQLYPNKSITELIAIGTLYKGLGITLIRGFIVNGASFYFYSKIKNSGVTT